MFGEKISGKLSERPVLRRLTEAAAWTVAAIFLALLYHELWQPRVKILSPDSFAYLAAARDMAGGRLPLPDVWPGRLFQPLYSFYISLFIHFTGDPVFAALWASSLAAGLLAVAVFLLVRSIFGFPAAAAAFVLTATNPLSVTYSLKVLSEPLYLPLVFIILAVGMKVWTAGPSRGRRNAALAFGALSGLAYLTRVPGVLFGGGLLAALLSRAIMRKVRGAGSAPLRATATAAAALVAGFFLTAGPYLVELRLVEGSWGLRPSEPVSIEYLDQVSRGGRAGESLDDMHEAPENRGLASSMVLDGRKWVRHTLENLLRALLLTFWEVGPAQLLLALLTLFKPVVPGGETDSRAGARFLFAWAIFFMFFHSVFIVNNRYLLPVYLIFLALAAGGLGVLGRLLVKKLPRRFSAPPRAPAALTTLLLASPFLVFNAYAAPRLFMKSKSVDQFKYFNIFEGMAREIGPAIADLDHPARIMMRRPEIAYFLGTDFLFLPNRLPDELLAAARKEKAEFIFFSQLEVLGYKYYRTGRLLDPRQAPPGLSLLATGRLPEPSKLGTDVFFVFYRVEPVSGARKGP